MKQKYVMNKIRAVRLVFVALLGSVLSMVVVVPQANAATCYTETGPLRVSPTTSTCSIDPSGRTSYVTAQGAPITDPISGANANNCYAGKSSGSGSFVTITYTLQNCSDLEALRTAVLQQACTASDGVWDTRYEGSQLTTRCYCPAGQTANSQGSCSTPAPTTPPADSGPTAGPTLEVSGSAQKILDYVQTGINLMTGIAGVAIAAMVVVGGIQYSTAGGNPQAAAAAKKRITNAVIALLALTFLYTFLQWLVPGGIFG